MSTRRLVACGFAIALVAAWPFVAGSGRRRRPSRTAGGDRPRSAATACAHGLERDRAASRHQGRQGARQGARACAAKQRERRCRCRPGQGARALRQSRRALVGCAQNELPGCCRKSSSCRVECRPRMALRWGKRPKRSMTAWCASAHFTARGRLALPSRRRSVPALSQRPRRVRTANRKTAGPGSETCTSKPLAIAASARRSAWGSLANARAVPRNMLREN